MKKQKKKINAKLTMVKGVFTPLVEVDYWDKDDHKHSGLILLDTGSTANYLFVNIGGNDVLSGRTAGTKVIAHNSLKAEFNIIRVKFPFAFGGKQFRESFVYSEAGTSIETRAKIPIIGILGNIFMEKYDLAIDFSNGAVYSSQREPGAICAGDCDLFFPMGCGLYEYDVPIVNIIYKRTRASLVARTGSLTNEVSQKCIKRCHLECEFSEKADARHEMSGDSEDLWANVKFNLHTLAGTRPLETVPYEDNFMVTDYPFRARTQKSPALDGIIGALFMAKYGWVLDFGAGIIYHKKSN